jgi:hypothetical protein
MSSTRREGLLDIGWVAYITCGPHARKLAESSEIIDQNRVSHLGKETGHGFEMHVGV